jgi:hypothetical protein
LQAYAQSFGLFVNQPHVGSNSELSRPHANTGDGLFVPPGCTRR